MVGPRFQPDFDPRTHTYRDPPPPRPTDPWGWFLGGSVEDGLSEFLGQLLGPTFVNVTDPQYAGGADVVNADNLSAFQAAAAAAAGRILVIPAGTYFTSGTTQLLAGTCLLNYGTVKFTSTATGGKAIFNVAEGVAGVRVDGGTLDGNKANNATTSGGLFGIMVRGGASVRISNVTAQNFPASAATGGQGGDGLLIARGLATGTVPVDVVVSYSTFDSNVRTGTALISGDNIRFVCCTFSNTTGNNTGAGCDVEPDTTADTLTSVRFIGCIFKGNQKGLQFADGNQALIRDIQVIGGAARDNRSRGFYAVQAGGGGWDRQNITVTNFTMTGNGTADAAGGYGAHVASRAQVTFSNCFISDNAAGGVYATSTQNVCLNGCTIVLNGKHGVLYDFIFGGNIIASLSGNTILNNGTSAVNTYDGVNFSGNVTHTDFTTTIVGGSIGNHANWGVASQRYGINAAATAVNVHAWNVNMFGNLSGDYSGPVTALYTAAGALTYLGSGGTVTPVAPA